MQLQSFVGAEEIEELVFLRDQDKALVPLPASLARLRYQSAPSSLPRRARFGVLRVPRRGMLDLERADAFRRDDLGIDPVDRFRLVVEKIVLPAQPLDHAVFSSMSSSSSI